MSIYEYITYDQDLYVMQAEHGLIKIGRSVDPNARRRQLQSLEHCRIELVTVLPSKGRREEAVHRQLAKHRIEGEWFEGHQQARIAIQRVLRAGQLAWPFELDPEAAALWLDRWFGWRDQRYNINEYNRQLRMLRSHDEPSWLADNSAWTMLWISRAGGCPDGEVCRENGEVVTYSHHPETKVRMLVPRFSADLGAAMSLWTDDERPTTWDGTALECCIAALESRRRRLPKEWQKIPVNALNVGLER